MTIQRKGRIVGAALLICLCATRVSSAQEPVTPPSTSEAAPMKYKPPSQTDAAPAEYLVAKPSEGRRMGLVGRFLDDQREIWTGPARLRFSDTEWLVPLGGVTAGRFSPDRELWKDISRRTANHAPHKEPPKRGVARPLSHGRGGGRSFGR